jgi:hypothetical protein
MPHYSSLFLENKDKKPIFTIPSLMIEILLVDFMKNEINRVINKKLPIKQVQSAIQKEPIHDKLH